MPKRYDTTPPCDDCGADYALYQVITKNGQPGYTRTARRTWERIGSEVYKSVCGDCQSNYLTKRTSRTQKEFFECSKPGHKFRGKIKKGTGK
jgi:ribosomal protein L37AE/L43A